MKLKRQQDCRRAFLIAPFLFGFVVIFWRRNAYGFNKNTDAEARAVELGLMRWKDEVTTALSDLRRRTWNMTTLVTNEVRSEFDFRFLGDGSNCTDDPRTRIVIGVASAPDRFEARRTIRTTWGRVGAVPGFRLVFLVGMTPDTEVARRLLLEETDHHDIVRADFVDSYRNLTLKSAALLRWTLHRCSGVDYLVKVDDDVFLDIPNLLRVLRRHEDVDRAVVGFRVEDAHVERKPTHKFYVSPKTYAAATYPTYAGGPCYILTGDTVRLLFAATSRVPFLPMEDVFVTGLCAQAAGVRVVDDPAMNTNAMHLLDLCAMRSQAVVHGATVREVTSLWTNRLTNRSDCRNLGELVLQYALSES